MFSVSRSEMTSLDPLLLCVSFAGRLCARMVFAGGLTQKLISAIITKVLYSTKHVIPTIIIKFLSA